MSHRTTSLMIFAVLPMFCCPATRLRPRWSTPVPRSRRQARACGTRAAAPLIEENNFIGPGAWDKGTGIDATEEVCVPLIGSARFERASEPRPPGTSASTMA